ncbi:MAG TPA: hypothetical protein VF884_03560 [Nitrososphaeraceae archaeon]
MPVNLRAKVIGIGIDNDPFTGRGYTLVQLGIELDIAPPPCSAGSKSVPACGWDNPLQTYFTYLCSIRPVE